ncbi:hypothetical protein ABTX99_28895, partial [Streptomyces flaveolus]
MTDPAGVWLARSTAASVQHTGAVCADRFDRIAWRDIYEQSAALRELAAELGERHPHTADLLTDAFLAAYKAAARLREPHEMTPSRLVNHRIITALLESPDFAELHRETAGDPYAAAMAVLAQGTALRRMLEDSRPARDQDERAQRARQEAEEAADAVAEALQHAAEEADEDGTVPGPEADAVRRAVQYAKAAAERAALDAARSLAVTVP